MVARRRHTEVDRFSEPSCQPECPLPEKYIKSKEPLGIPHSETLPPCQSHPWSPLEGAQHLPSKSGMESLEKVSRASRSLPSLEPLRLCLCFLRKKERRAAADSVFAVLSSLTSDMLSLLENSWSILQSERRTMWGGPW